MLNGECVVDDPLDIYCLDFTLTANGTKSLKLNGLYSKTTLLFHCFLFFNFISKWDSNFDWLSFGMLFCVLLVNSRRFQYTIEQIIRVVLLMVGHSSMAVLTLLLKFTLSISYTFLCSFEISSILESFTTYWSLFINSRCFCCYCYCCLFVSKAFENWIFEVSFKRFESSFVLGQL